MELHGIPMHRYTLDKSALDINNVTVFTKAVFDVSRVLGGPLFFSLPRFLHSDSLHEELNLPAPEEKKHESFVSIRIFSGNFVCLCVCVNCTKNIWFIGLKYSGQVINLCHSLHLSCFNLLRDYSNPLSLSSAVLSVFCLSDLLLC